MAEDDRDLVSRVLAGVEGALRRPGRRGGEEYEIDVKHYSEVIAPALDDGRSSWRTRSPNAQTVTFHDSCHVGRAQGIYEPPREMLKAIPGIELTEMAHNREEGLCCGSVLTLIGEIEVAPVLGPDIASDEAVDAGAETSGSAVSVLPGAASRHSNIKNDLGPQDSTDLARVVAEAAGYDHPGRPPSTPCTCGASSTSSSSSWSRPTWRSS